jgi:hypothetical protein
MNRLKQILDRETRNKLLNYLRPWAYFIHPELKIKDIPKKRWKMLMTMKALRLWIIENAPQSKRYQKYYSEIYHINNELNYLQFRGNIFIFIIQL